MANKFVFTNIILLNKISIIITTKIKIVKDNQCHQCPKSILLKYIIIKLLIITRYKLSFDLISLSYLNIKLLT